MPSEGSTDAYKTVPAFGGLFFEQPVQVVFAPGETQRAFVVERTGRIAVVRDTTAPSREVFLDLAGKTETTNGGLLSMAFHPQFAANGQFYVWYSTHVNGQRANRLARYRATNTTVGNADPSSETPLITQLTGPGGHDGGMLLFGPDGYLYLSIGDGDQNVPEINAAHQRIDRGFFGGVLRIDVDGKAESLTPNPHASVHAGTYRIPPDNPFVGATAFNGEPVNPAAVRTEFWATGLRNPWRMAFDSADGRLWLADVGLFSREEINLVTRGANFGWDFREGTAAGPRKDAPSAAAQLTAPIWEYPAGQAASITGGFVYRGTTLRDLAGHYLFADFMTGHIWALLDNGERPLRASQVRQIAAQTGITSLTFDPRTGDVLLADFDSNVIQRLAPNPNAGGTPLPATLADTGIFSDVANLTPAAGVVAYAPNVSFWSDYGHKTRWFAVPDTTSTFGFAPHGPWRLPAGAVWVKHFDLELRRGVPSSAHRVETRVLVKTADGIYGATYRWNEAQTNATLVAKDGAGQEFAVVEPDGTTRNQAWRFPSRDNCLTCHTEKGGGILSFNTRQLNRVAPGGSANQLAELAASGYLAGPVPDPAALPALADPADPTWPLETRARAYLDANCAQCHQPGGTAQGGFDARATTPLSLTGIVNGRLFATADTTDADRVIVPGDTAHSVLIRRMSQTAATRMPPLGSNERDRAGEALIREWIAELARPQPPSRLLNLAARAHVGTNGDVLIPGFVIGGTAPKNILLRAVGPALEQFEVGGALGAPALHLFDEQQRVIASNTRWATAPNAGELRAAAQRVGAFALPDSSADSALLVTLPPGAYTAQTAGAGGTTGVALVEIYDADATPRATSPRLINTAVRAHVGTGANILIPGLVVSDGAPKNVLIRAVGPTLAGAPFHVPGTLAAPVLALFAGSERFVVNAGWSNAANAAEIRATAANVGAFPLTEGSHDSAMLVSLSPGAYTVQVTGAHGTSSWKSTRCRERAAQRNQRIPPHGTAANPWAAADARAKKRGASGGSAFNSHVRNHVRLGIRTSG